MKQVWHVSAGSTSTLVGHTCQESLRLLRHQLSRSDRRALEAGRSVFKLEACPHCQQRRLVEFELRPNAGARLPLALLGGD